MKRVFRIVMLLALVAFISVMNHEPSTAERPTGTRYSGSAAFEVLNDTTALIAVDSAVTTTGGNKLLLFTGLQDYSSVSGYISGEYFLIDTNAGGEFIDTTKDTLAVELWTAWEADYTPSKLVWVCTLITNSTNNSYQYFNLSDSLIGQVLYAKLLYTVSDSDNSVARDTLGITLKVTTSMIAN